MNRVLRCASSLVTFVALTTTTLDRASAQVSWDGGNGTFVWGDFGNWNPDGNPIGTAISIGNLPSATNDTTLVDGIYVALSLAISNGADVVNSPDGGTTDFELEVIGATTISGAGSSFVVYGGNPDGLDTGTLTINSGADLILNSQQAVGTAVVEVDSGALTNNVGGLISGNGSIELVQNVGIVTTLLNNEGTLTATAIGALVSPPSTTLTIGAPDAQTRVDLDGAVGNAGVVNVNRNATLDINVPLSDSFSGDLNLAAGATLDINSPWAISAGTVDVNTPGVIVGTAGPAAHLDGAAISMVGGILTLNDGNDSLVFDATFDGTIGTIENSGSITFNAPATFGSGVDFNMNGSNSKLVVNSTVDVHMPDFNLDGNGAAGNVTTINAGGDLDLDLGAGADRFFNHTINLNGGNLEVTSSVADGWGMDSIGGVLNAGGAAVSTINGETFQLLGNSTVNVAANSTLHIVTSSQIVGASMTFSVAAGGTLDFSNVNYNSGPGATFTGDGILRKGVAEISGETFWNVAIVDLDDGSTMLNEDLTITTNSIEETPNDGFDSTITINDTRLLTVSIAGSNFWTIDPAGVIDYNGNAATNSYLAGSDIKMNGQIDHTGDGRIDARLDIGPTGVINISTAGQRLRLSGGDSTFNQNTISGGTINGPGILAADVTTSLSGFGTINADIEFLSVAHLSADNGTLKVNGNILTVSEIHVIGADAVLDITNPWNTNVAAAVSIGGGELTGGLITNDDTFGISGRGLLSAQVINNTRIRGLNFGTLVVETPGNNNDWDGATGTGLLWADSANLELRDNATFQFSGTVTVAAGRTVVANGFELDFQPGSTLNLTAGTYFSTESSDFGGAVMVNAGGASVLKGGAMATFESTSVTVLNGDLELESDTTIVAAGADFSGSGRLVVTGEHVLAPDGAAVIDVLVQNDGVHEVAGAAIGRNDVLEYIQSASGRIEFDIFGTTVGVFDRMFVDGQMQLAGELALGIGGGYVPTLGDTITLISTLGGFVDEFDSLAQPAGLPSGLQFSIVYQPQFVRVMVVEQLPGDYNYDGIVDAADFTAWRDTLGSNSLLAADGNHNNMIDAGDYDVWKNNFGDTAGSGAASQSVPEPGVTVLLVIGLLQLAASRRR